MSDRHQEILSTSLSYENVNTNYNYSKRMSDSGICENSNPRVYFYEPDSTVVQPVSAFSQSLYIDGATQQYSPDDFDLPPNEQFHQPRMFRNIDEHTKRTASEVTQSIDKLSSSSFETTMSSGISSHQMSKSSAHSLYESFYYKPVPSTQTSSMPSDCSKDLSMPSHDSTSHSSLEPDLQMPSDFNKSLATCGQGLYTDTASKPSHIQEPNHKIEKSENNTPSVTESHNILYKMYIYILYKCEAFKMWVCGAQHPTEGQQLCTVQLNNGSIQCDDNIKTDNMCGAVVISSALENRELQNDNLMMLDSTDSSGIDDSVEHQSGDSNEPNEENDSVRNEKVVSENNFRESVVNECAPSYYTSPMPSECLKQMSLSSLEPYTMSQLPQRSKIPRNVNNNIEISHSESSQTATSRRIPPGYLTTRLDVSNNVQLAQMPISSFNEPLIPKSRPHVQFVSMNSEFLDSGTIPVGSAPKQQRKMHIECNANNVSAPSYAFGPTSKQTSVQEESPWEYLQEMSMLNFHPYVFLPHPHYIHNESANLYERDNSVQTKMEKPRRTLPTYEPEQSMPTLNEVSSTPKINPTMEFVRIAREFFDTMDRATILQSFAAK